MEREKLKEGKNEIVEEGKNRKGHKLGEMTARVGAGLNSGKIYILADYY